VVNRERIKVCILGAGSWGTALAILLSRNGFSVSLWSHLPEQAACLAEERSNREFLPGIPFPERLRPTADLGAALAAAHEALVVVPSHAFRPVLQSAAPLLAAKTTISWATKGLEPGTGQLLHQVAREILGDRSPAIISGPSFATEVARGLPTAITVASPDAAHADRLAGYLHCDSFRPYTSDDIVGLEVGGAAKNVMAIAAGISDGLRFGANSRAALITRGLAEITRLGLALGGRRETLMGLGGLGDLVLTCTDDQSRNRRMGLALARGLSVEQARDEIGQEVEGVMTAREIHQRARTLRVAMPITEQTYRVLHEGLAPDAAVRNLLEREYKPEIG